MITHENIYAEFHQEYAEERLRRERAEAACAEMRAALDELMLKTCEFIVPDEDGHPECVCCGMCLQDNLGGHRLDCLAKAIQDQAHALSTDCGKGWVSPEERKQLEDALLATEYCVAGESHPANLVERAKLLINERATLRAKNVTLQAQLKLAVEALARVPCNCSSLRIGSNLHDRDCAKLSAQQTLSQLKGQQ